MIKFKASGKGGKTILGFGLTAKNVEQLKIGNPIFIFGEEIGIPFDVAIFYGETEQEMAAKFRREGLIDPVHTVIHDSSQYKRTRN